MYICYWYIRSLSFWESSLFSVTIIVNIKCVCYEEKYTTDTKNVVQYAQYLQKYFTGDRFYKFEYNRQFVTYISVCLVHL